MPPANRPALQPTEQEILDIRHMVPPHIPDSEVAAFVQLPDSTGITLLQLYRQMVLALFYAENS